MADLKARRAFRSPTWQAEARLKMKMKRSGKGDEAERGNWENKEAHFLKLKVANVVRRPLFLTLRKNFNK
ncbi:hypothetical protein SDJN02_07468, partial [Cucurbita argyrosperma subsp. argyrosperma]